MNYKETLIRIIETAFPLIDVLTESDLSAKTAPEKWSIKEILGHLIDSAYNNHSRFIRAITQGELIFEGYDQVKWVETNNYNFRNGKSILNFWYSVNIHLAETIGNIDFKQMNIQTIKHNIHEIGMNAFDKNQSASLSFLIWDYIFHLEHHLAQIIPNYKKLNQEFKA